MIECLVMMKLVRIFDRERSSRIDVLGLNAVASSRSVSEQNT